MMVTTVMLEEDNMLLMMVLASRGVYPMKQGCYQMTIA
jgi:hypothetical protein